MGINYKTYHSGDANQGFLISYYMHVNSLLPSTATVDEWLSVPYCFTEYILTTYPNAKKAQEIRDSKLAKVLE